jgi:putative membrane protein insertion efficiency factor
LPILRICNVRLELSVTNRFNVAAATTLFVSICPVVRLLRHISIILIRCGVIVYRATLRPFLGGQCRYTPTCSDYMLQAVDKHGPWRGGWMGVRRIGRCHPWGGSGYDPP